MSGRLVVVVLVALIALGVAGLVVRVLSSDENELVLSGLLPLSQDVIDRVTIASSESEVELARIDDKWQVAANEVSRAKLRFFWTIVAEIDGAQLVAKNPANHERMGVAEGQGTIVSFYLGPAIQERFIIGKWDPNVALCYLRRSGKDEVYGIGCPIDASEIFGSDSDSWHES